MVRRNPFRSPAWLLGAVLALPFLPVLFAPAGRVLGYAGCDGPSMFYYFNAFAGSCWRQGQVPLWNPYIMLGHPFLGEGQAALFHPLSWLFILLPTGAAINWLAALSFLLTGLFFYGYLRALDLSPGSSFCGALVWCGSSVLIPRLYAGHLTILLEHIEIPLLLMLWERYRRQRQIKYLAGFALAYGAMILAAYPQLLYIFSLFFLCYVLLQAALACTAKAAARAESRALLWLGAFVLLGIGIGAVQLLPSADFAAQSFRRQASIEFSGVFSFPPENLLTLLAPRFFGYAFKTPVNEYWGYGNFWEMACYIGILPLVLVVPGLLGAPRNRRIPLIACAAIFFIFALGRHTPLFPLIYKCVPFFHFFRGPSKYMVITQLCLVTLSAYGFESLFHASASEAGRRRLKAALITGAALLVLVLVLALYLAPHPDAPGSHWIGLVTSIVGPEGQRIPPQAAITTARLASHELLRAALFLALSLGLVTLVWKEQIWRRALAPLAAVLVLADLLLVFFPLFKTYDESMTRAPEQLIAPLHNATCPPRVLAPDLSPNLPMVYGFSSPSGYTGNTLARFNTCINAMNGQPAETEQVLNPVSDFRPQMSSWAFDALILPERNLAPGMQVLARAGGRIAVRFPGSFPRASLAASPHYCASAAEALQYVLASGPALLASPAIECPTSSALPPAAPLRPEELVKITAFTPNRVELETRAAQPRVLLLAEMFEKNWTAAVNGVAAPVFPANYLFRGIVVPPGPARVVFAYRPAAFRWGAVISILALAGALGLGFRFRNQLPQTPAAHPPVGEPAAPPVVLAESSTPSPARAPKRKSRIRAR